MATKKAVRSPRTQKRGSTTVLPSQALHASGNSVLPAGSALNICPWCQRETETKLTQTQRICIRCCALRFKCSKCSKAAKKNVLKPFIAFSLERMRKCKQQHTLTTRLMCVACDTSSEPPTRYRYKETHYTCSRCRQTKPREDFQPADLKSRESSKQIYLAVCEACASQSQPGASEKHVKCEHCSQTQPLAAYSAPMRRRHDPKWICWACQHPKCTGNGCEALQPTARVGTYTCEQCLFPPCQKCMTTPRPRSTKYRITHMPQWICSICCRNCQNCGAKGSEKNGSATNKHLKTLCKTCCFPPCHKCTTTPRPQFNNYAVTHMPQWVCGACRRSV